ncbi:MAG: hypothetical protein AB7P76_12760 [Candidatus Melainabacteria bacterium]
MSEPSQPKSSSQHSLSEEDMSALVQDFQEIQSSQEQYEAFCQSRQNLLDRLLLPECLN